MHKTGTKETFWLNYYFLTKVSFDYLNQGGQDKVFIIYRIPSSTVFRHYFYPLLQDLE